MNKFIVIPLLFCYITVSYGQKDTLWFDKKWKETTKKNAHFYRPSVKKEGKLYRVNDFYINGSLQMTGLSKRKDSINIFQAVWYNEQGHPTKELNCDKDKRNGTCTYYIEKEDKTTIAREELTYKDGKVIKTIYFEGDKNGIRLEGYYDNGMTVKNIYYDKNGKEIGQATYNDGQTVGKKVQYYYNPMRVKSITEYQLGTPVFTRSFYPNGSPRNQFNETTLTETFYDDQGNRLGAIKYQYSKESKYKTPYEGTAYSFSYKNPSSIEKIKTFKRGLVIGIDEFNEQGILIKREEYTDEGIPVKIISYDNTGRQIGVLQKINDKLEGRLVETKKADNKDITYKNGIVQEAIEYYTDTTSIFLHLKDSLITYYDISGKKLGKLKVIPKENHYSSGILGAAYYEPTPVEGSLFKINYKNKIVEKHEFKNKKLRAKTTYTYLEDDNLYKEMEIYNDKDASKTITYYINGGKKSEISYDLNSYRKKSMAVYYDKTGKVMASYNFKTKTGTEYKYFYRTDQIETMKQYEEGKLIKIKSYQKEYNLNTGEYEYVLREEVDINSQALFYSKEGKLIAQATFTNQKPTGKMYDYKKHREIYMKNGLKEGSYRKFNYDEETLQEKGYYLNDKKHGTFTYYYQNGKKQKEENYREGEKEGYTIYYNKNGSEDSRLLYKNGKPFEGQKPSLYGNKKFYKDGAIIKEIQQKENQKTITEYLSEHETNTTIYDSIGNTLLSYGELNNQLHGKVVQYQNNKPRYTAVFSKGKLTKGTVWIKADSQFQSEAYSQLNREEDLVTIKTYNKENILLFNGTINPALYKNYNENILSYKLGIRNIYRENLYIFELPE
ncbi:hypothetical protein MQE36_08955 [Zhouia spongiae]|uniref:Toxin-antitoxin system YwqK family antitoxin n=1 Tax=Zhouia spongiae TaxID=2202721 RepID=A0ABY3YHS1_9FLAO|nr:hypothetical protein [Zhouia spongiae]UNY97225.1 hypothetical protein MQE36_08955 [Zhouia spongiae]